MSFAQVEGSYDSDVYRQISEAYKLRTSNLDSALTLWYDAEVRENKSPDINERAYLYKVGASLFRQKSDFDRSFQLAYKSVSLYQKLEDPFAISTVYLELGNNFIAQGILDSAKYYFEETLRIKEDLDDDKEGLGITLSNLGVVHDYLGNYDLASQYYHRSIDLNKETGNLLQVADTYHNLSIVQYHLGNIDDAIKYQERAIPLNEELENLYSKTMNHICVAAFYLEKEDLVEAEKHGLLSASLSEELDFQTGSLYAWSSLGDVYLRSGEYSKAIDYYDQFLGLVDDEGNIYMKAQTQHKKAKALLQSNRAKEAYVYLNSALSVFEEQATLKELKEVHEDFAAYYHNTGEHVKAYNFLRKSNELRDSLFTTEKTAEILKLETSFKTREKEIENQMLIADQQLKQAKIQTQNYLLWGGGLALLLITLLSILLFRQWKVQKELNHILSDKSEKIKLLNRELNHRVKNNLAFMTSLMEMQARRAESHEAREALLGSEARLRTLSLVHSSLYIKGEDNTVNIHDYLNELIQGLFDYFVVDGKKINFDNEIESLELDAEDAMRIGLVINELVTNSVKHAFVHHPEPGIRIQIKKDKNGIIDIHYADNERGKIDIPPNIEDDTGSSSLGLKLIKLLTMQLGEEYRFLY
jgi:two-component system, sensor histidine kinase PdtaS